MNNADNNAFGAKFRATLPKLLLIPLFTLFLFACSGEENVSGNNTSGGNDKAEQGGGNDKAEQGGGNDKAEQGGGNDKAEQESFAFTQTEITKVIGNASFTVVASGGSGTGAISYISDKAEIASVDLSSGEITIVSKGTTTIRATREADEIYPQATASLSLTVIDPIGDACTDGEIPTIAAGVSDFMDALNIAKDNGENNGGVTVICKYVTEAGAGNKDGISWEHAYGVEHLRTLTDVDDASANKKYIYLVKAGTYTPADENGSRETSFSLKNHVAITGGWSGTAFERGGDTIFSGDLNGDDDGLDNIDDNSYHVFKHDIGVPYLDNSAILYGVTISAGNADVNTAAQYGGGMYNYSSHPVVSNTSFSGNTAALNGGGMYNSSSDPVVSNTSFSNNGAKKGGGMYNVNSHPEVSNTTFSNNGAADDGGGMYNSSSDPVVSNTSFSGNTSTNDGGGMYNSGSNPVVSSNTSFSGNTAYDGAGMYNDSSNPEVSNTSFSGNTAADDGGGMYNSSSDPVVSNTSFSNNGATWGGGMINNNDSNPVVSNTSFSGNTAFTGGGMYNSSSDPVVSNTSFSDNTARQKGGGMYNFDSSNPVVSNSIFWGNTAASGAQIHIYGATNGISLGSVVLEGGIGGIEGSGVIKDNKIIENDPKLRDLDNNGGFVQTMALGDGSSAIDEGLYIKRAADNRTYYYSADNTTWYATPLLNSGVVSPTDAVLLDKDARGYPHQGKPDIGAYESQGVP